MPTCVEACPAEAIKFGKRRDLIEMARAQIAKDPTAYFGAGELEKAKTKLIDQNILSEEVASSFVTQSLAFWWSVATTDYFYGYEGNCRKVGWADISSLIGAYLADAPSASAVRIRSEAYASDPSAADREKALGYTAIGPDNAFWWQK